MSYSSKIINDAVEAFSSLPSVGKKSAMRLVLHLAGDKYTKKEKLLTAIHQLQNDLKVCKICFGYSDSEMCSICSNPLREQHTLCVVENIRDLIAIEETGSFRGRYHVLGGIISPLEGVGPEMLTIDSLIQRVHSESIQEIVMAISPNIDGETTIFYISRLLESSNVLISAIARGVSFGSDLEYTDEFTLGKSIKARMPYQQTSL